MPEVFGLSVMTGEPSHLNRYHTDTPRWSMTKSTTSASINDESSIKSAPSFPTGLPCPYYTGVLVVGRQHAPSHVYCRPQWRSGLFPHVFISFILVVRAYWWALHMSTDSGLYRWGDHKKQLLVDKHLTAWSMENLETPKSQTTFSSSLWCNTIWCLRSNKC